MVNFLKKFHFCPSTAKQIQSLEKGIHLCPSCKHKEELEDLDSLTFQNCTKCDELFLVPKQFNDWWVLKPLGSGGFGMVYQAVHKEHNHIEAAVKVINSQEAATAEREALIQEASTAKLFGEHPNLSYVYNYGYDDGCSFMIMQKIHGERLDHIIDNHPTGLPLELSLYYTLDILEALNHILSTNHLYRDLKPENIIINDENHAVLVDYGLCMTLEDAWYKIEDQFFGSPMYMPPERILGEGEDYRADIYSLGMVLYHCIKGQTYFNDNEIMRLVNRQASNLRIKTSTKLTNFTDEVAQLIDDLIAPDRSMRYDGYELIRQDICHILDDLQQNESSHPLILKRRQEFK